MSDTDKTGRQGINFCNGTFTDSDWKFREQRESDYGIDAQVETTDKGEPTGRLLALQIKAGPSYFSEPTKDGWKRRFKERHRKLWLEHSLPVVIVLVDYEQKIGYWQVVTEDTVQKAKTRFYVVVPEKQQLNEDGLKELWKLASAEKPKKERLLPGSGPGEIFETEDFQWLPSYTPEGVRHALYPKEGKNAVPSVQLRFEDGQEESLRDFHEKGIGGEFDARIIGSNFLPKGLISESRVRVRTSDRKLKGVFPVLFYWSGVDGYRFQREINLHSVRAGTKEMVLESTIDQVDHLIIVADLEDGKVEKVDFAFKIAGCFAKKAHDVLRFYVSGMAGPGSISLVLKNSGDELLSGKWEQKEEEKTINSCDLLEKYLELEKYLDKPLKVPSEWFETSDILGILEVHEILMTGKLSLGNCKVTLPVDLTLAEKMKKEVDGSVNVALKNDKSKRLVAGYDFELGPCLTVIHDPIVAYHKGSCVDRT